MKGYVVLCYNALCESTEVISIHTTYKGACKSMESEASKMINNGLTVIEEKEESISLGFNLLGGEEVREDIAYYIVAKDLQE